MMPETPVTSVRPAAARVVGELTIIVLGVLIALWADGCAQERADRTIEESRIVALQENVSATAAALAEARVEAQQAAQALREIAYWEDLPAPSRQSEEVILQGFLFGPSFAPELNVYVDLKSSGELALLRSAELRQALGRLDATLEQVYLLQDDMTAVQQLNYDPYIIQQLALDGMFGENLGLDGLPRSPAPGPDDLTRLRTLALFKLDLVALLLEALDDVQQALDAVDVTLELAR
jgi:hypothetical protein